MFKKYFFFMFLATFSLFTSAVTFLFHGLHISLIVLGGGLLISYVTMLKKKNFTHPEKKQTAQRMARLLSLDTSPLSIARFASQLYYYLHEPSQAIALLEKFLPSYHPVLCTTLGDILIREGKAQQALNILRDNPYADSNALLLATQGYALIQVNKISEAASMFEHSLYFSNKCGFPYSGSNWFTQKLLSLSYTACIHHTLADCYVMLGNIPKARLHYRAGNRLYFDISLWRFY